MTPIPCCVWLTLVPSQNCTQPGENGQVLLVLSEAICEELSDVLGRPKTWRYVDEERGEAFLRLLRQRAEFVTPSPDTPPCRDPDDVAILGTALAGQVPYLVSSDKDLYDDAALLKDLNERGVKVVSVSQVIAQLKN